MEARSGEPGAKASGAVGPIGNRAVRPAGVVMAVTPRVSEVVDCGHAKPGPGRMASAPLRNLGRPVPTIVARREGQIVTGSADVQRAVDALARALSQPVLIEDARHQPLWWSAQDEVDGTRIRTILHRGVPPAAAALVVEMRLAAAAGPVRTPAVPEADMLPRWCVPLRAGRALLGYLWVLDARGTVAPADLPSLVACAELAAATLARDAAAAVQRD